MRLPMRSWRCPRAAARVHEVEGAADVVARVRGGDGGDGEGGALLRPVRVPRAVPRDAERPRVCGDLAADGDGVTHINIISAGHHNLGRRW